MDYDSLVVLETERLLFRQHIPADMDAYCDMEQDADVRRYVGGAPRTREDAERRFQNGLKPVGDKLAMWATIFKTENKYIGRCGLYPHFNNDGVAIAGEASLGLYIARAYWGRGFATEAGRAFVTFGFEELNINRIVTLIEVGNDASVHVIEKIGFRLAAKEEGHRSFYHYEIIRSMYQNALSL